MSQAVNDNIFREVVEKKQLLKEYREFETQYKVALMASHQCQVDEIILDQDDTLRSQVLEQILNDIRIQYLPFRQDQ